MNFFIPSVDDTEEAENIYTSLCKLHNASISNRRIFKLHWYNKYAKRNIITKVGDNVPQIYGGEVVIAIIELTNCYIIITPNRSIPGTDPLYVGVNFDTHVDYFDEVKTNGESKETRKSI